MGMIQTQSGGYDKENIAEAFGLEKERYVPGMLLFIGKAAEEGFASYRLPVEKIAQWKSLRNRFLGFLFRLREIYAGNLNAQKITEPSQAVICCLLKFIDVDLFHFNTIFRQSKYHQTENEP